ncbi:MULTISPECIES: MarR family winged helix-turn-helix transcriptional regulator [Micrococcaceae]|mgnify:CR=1 FL=1|uniref:MarR family winged helix-turn-helix transcriptional regulator n=1 Tax=Micrococcaceae TaxID=1268 RepID=UPI0016182503|nr:MULTISPECIES: MarR family transcriptional regulator [Micrococcaceae]MBB5750026.1 DNA-binding MarR family transcriptional regulator [Micrococcus sp. TA1]HRO30721.1 MarR family transcriptional regulator [Citricoccus sp.]HRO94364.1 MarR family transcriptional regulator [Citricoccus sp.]
MDTEPDQESHSPATAPPGLVEGWFIYTIKQLESGLRAPLEQAAQQAAGLTTAQYTALAVLARWPGITSSELARRSFVRAQTMAETMTPLLEAGYVRRSEDAASGRRIPLYLTDAGREVLESLSGPVSALESALLAAIPPAERQSFASNLRACRTALAGLPR